MLIEVKKMNIKKVVLVLILAIAILLMIAPANAKLEADLYLLTSMKDDKKVAVHLEVRSDIGLDKKNNYLVKYCSARKAELNKVYKIDVKVRGFKTITLMKPANGWKVTDSQVALTHVVRKTCIDGISYKELKNKDYSVKLYDKNNKLLKSKKGILNNMF